MIDVEAYWVVGVKSPFMLTLKRAGEDEFRFSVWGMMDEELFADLYLCFWKSVNPPMAVMGRDPETDEMVLLYILEKGVIVEIAEG